jgi:6-phosphofructokinase 2
MKTIATLTMNPTIDIAYDVDRLFHTHKMRTQGERCDPGGGGINVARVFCRLGGLARCFYLAGGATGVALDGLLDEHRLLRTRIDIAGSTRVAAAVHERDSGKEYRFTPPGPEVSAAEWQACLDLLADAECDYFIASGSLPPGVPDDFYARVAAALRARGIAFVLDSSGEPLKQTLAAGGVHLIKPSSGELRQLAGRELTSREAIADAAMAIVRAGRAELVAVTLGHQGALLARAEGTLYLPAVDIEARSAVGAGDSFLATMVHALAGGRDVVEAFRRGMAGGAASVLNPGTGLAHPDDIARLLPLVAAG